MDSDSKVINYMKLSALVYAQFNNDTKGHDIGYIMKNKLYNKDFKSDKPDLSALKE